MQSFAGKATFVDLVLLKRRNAIAHGEDTLVGIEDLDELTTETVAIMRAFGDALENHVYLKDYRAA
jgi:MAE_28990/MAE_18760-like HEPN